MGHPSFIVRTAGTGQGEEVLEAQAGLQLRPLPGGSVALSCLSCQESCDTRERGLPIVTGPWKNGVMARHGVGQRQAWRGAGGAALGLPWRSWGHWPWMGGRLQERVRVEREKPCKARRGWCGYGGVSGCGRRWWGLRCTSWSCCGHANRTVGGAGGAEGGCTWLGRQLLYRMLPHGICLRMKGHAGPLPHVCTGTYTLKHVLL